jgi:hypothetical protein
VIELVARYILPAAYSVLPPKMNSPEASALILAIGLQESQFMARRQLPRRPGGPPGPAKGLWQFERGGGVAGVMKHAKTKGPLLAALTELRYAEAMGHSLDLYNIIEHNDVVACVFARLNLWWLPAKLPGQHDPDGAWKQYLQAWKPGKPHHRTWNNYFIEAWHHVDQL